MRAADAVLPGIIQVLPITWCCSLVLCKSFLVLAFMRKLFGLVNPKLARIIRLSSPAPVLIIPVNLIQFRTMVWGSWIDISLDPGR